MTFKVFSGSVQIIRTSGSSYTYSRVPSPGQITFDITPMDKCTILPGTLVSAVITSTSQKIAKINDTQYEFSADNFGSIFYPGYEIQGLVIDQVADGGVTILLSKGKFIPVTTTNLKILSEI